MRILLAENDRSARDKIAESLVAAGFQVTAKSSGHDAIDAYNEAPFPMVLCGVELDDLDGLELCRTLRSQAYDNTTYFIWLTPESDEQTIKDAIASGIDDYVTTPCNQQELLLRINIGRRAVNVESSEMLVLTLSKLVELRSDETSNHLKRMSEFSLILSRELARTEKYCEMIDNEFLQLIAKTAWLHDLGKAAIPDSILMKPRSLSRSERSIMEQHAKFGADVFSTSLAKYPDNQFIRMAYDIAMTHHEKWDGSGYPQGLSGEDIPITGRIVAVCDAYDALTSVRIYNETIEHDYAVELVVDSSGSHFDPEVIRCFQKVLHQFQAVRERWPDAEETKTLYQLEIVA